MKLTILNSASLVLALLGSASATDSAVNLRGAVSAAIEYNPDKETAAEKRQANRDARRSRTNKNRSQAEEDAEAARKARQAANRGAEDPNNSWNNSRRNARNRIRCEMYGENCNYSADTFDDGYGDDYYGDDYYYDTTYSGDEFQKFGKTMSALKKAGVEADVVIDSGYNTNKNSAAQKRSMNRDARRSRTNKNRSQAEEDAEARRKRQQAKNRDNARADPNDSRYGNKNFQNQRNARNRARCARDGTNCNYSGESRNDDQVNVHVDNE